MIKKLKQMYVRAVRRLAFKLLAYYTKVDRSTYPSRYSPTQKIKKGDQL